MRDKKSDHSSNCLQESTLIKNNRTQYSTTTSNHTCCLKKKYSIYLNFDTQNANLTQLLTNPSNFNNNIKFRYQNDLPSNKQKSSFFSRLLLLSSTILLLVFQLQTTSFSSHHVTSVQAQQAADDATSTNNQQPQTQTISSAASTQDSSTAALCFGGIHTFEKISMSSFENPSGLPQQTSSTDSSTGQTHPFFESGILVQQDDQALTSECVNLCKSQSNCLSFVIDYNKFECKSYATTQQDLQQEFEAKFKHPRSSFAQQQSSNTSSTTTAASTVNSPTVEVGSSYQISSSNTHIQQLLPSASSNYFEKVCLDGLANKNQLIDICGPGRLWTIERVIDSFLDGFVEKELTNVNSKDECSKLCIFETQFVCRSADFDQQTKLCRLSKEDRRTQPQAMRYVANSRRHYLENQCATLGPTSCIYETKKNVGIISMDALKYANNVQECQMKCNQETTFNCRAYSFFQQRCFLSGDDSYSLDGNVIKLPTKNGWNFGEKKCLVEVCTKGVFSYEKITGHTLKSALSTPIDLMSSGDFQTWSSMQPPDDLDRLQSEHSRSLNLNSSSLATMMMLMMSNNNGKPYDPLLESASNSLNHKRSSSNLAVTGHCRQTCDLGYLNCPAFTIDYKNNRCQRLDRNSQGRHHELVPREGSAYFEKICLRVPEIMTMCQDKYWIFERVIGYELAPRFYNKTLKFVPSRRDCEEYCLEEKQFQCRSALFNDETSDCKLSSTDRRFVAQESGFYRNFNSRVSYLENQCIRERTLDRECNYEKVKEEPSYPTFTDHIEMVSQQALSSGATSQSINMESRGKGLINSTKTGYEYCEQLCNDNVKFECHAFGYYSSTAQCFLSGEDMISVGDIAASSSTGFVYYEKKCDSTVANGDYYDNQAQGGTTTPKNPISFMDNALGNPYFNAIPSNRPANTLASTRRPSFSSPTLSDSNVNNDKNSTYIDADLYKCDLGHTFVFQRVSGFEPIGGYLSLLVKDNTSPGIVAECHHLCKKALHCRAFIVDYNKNQCFAMLENSSVGLLSLRQTIGTDYFEGFCVANRNLVAQSNCNQKIWMIDKILDQAVIGVEPKKIIPGIDRIVCRKACIEEKLFWCKSAMFDSATNECSLYSIDRESLPQMRLQFNKGVDFYENQCQISTNSCPYDAIEKGITIVTTTKSLQAKSVFECENACDLETSFNCRSYTYLDHYPGLPNVCILSSDSRSTSQRGSVQERHRTLYAERNCFYRQSRLPVNLDPYDLRQNIPNFKPSFTAQNSGRNLDVYSQATTSTNQDPFNDNSLIPVSGFDSNPETVEKKDAKSLQSTFKTFRFPAGGSVNFEVQIKLCPDKCETSVVDSQQNNAQIRLTNRSKRNTELLPNTVVSDNLALQNQDNSNQNQAMKKSFEHLRQLMLLGDATPAPQDEDSQSQSINNQVHSLSMGTSEENKSSVIDLDNHDPGSNLDVVVNNPAFISTKTETNVLSMPTTGVNNEERILSPTVEANNFAPRPFSYTPSSAPYGRFPLHDNSLQKPFLSSYHPELQERKNPENRDKADVTIKEELESAQKNSEQVYTSSVVVNESPSVSIEYPLKFSSPVVENNHEHQWTPSQAFTNNRTNVESDDVVVPGAANPMEAPVESTPEYQSSPDSATNNQIMMTNEKRSLESIQPSKRLTHNDFDAQPSVSMKTEIQQSTNLPFIDAQESKIAMHEKKAHNLVAPMQTTTSNDCRDSYGSHLWTIIYTGSIVVAFNICLVMISLYFYFKRAKNHCRMSNIQQKSRHWADAFKVTENNFVSPRFFA